ncbi:SRPBCC domain-containing protein [Chlorobaculum sp. 24CR]|nr:SRPBCC domain-containing protein [Chlorobaculum sp. 24CR]
MKRVATELVIDAPPERVWAALADFGGYGAWNPCLRRISGEAGPGAKLRITIRFGWLPPIRFRARIDRLRRNELLGWRAAFLFGLLEGQHWFELHPLDAGKTRLVHAETFSGVLAAPFLSFFSGVICKSYEAANLALKAIVEQK